MRNTARFCDARRCATCTTNRTKRSWATRSRFARRGLVRKQNAGSCGDIVVCSVKSVLPGSDIKKKSGGGGVIARCRKPTRRSDGSYVRFDNNAIVIIDNDKNPRGTRIFGAVARELRDRNFMKIVS